MESSNKLGFIEWMYMIGNIHINDYDAMSRALESITNNKNANKPSKRKDRRSDKNTKE